MNGVGWELYYVSAVFVGVIHCEWCVGESASAVGWGIHSVCGRVLYSVNCVGWELYYVSNVGWELVLC